MSTWCLGLLFLLPCQDPSVRDLIERMGAESADERRHAFQRLRSLGRAAESDLRTAAEDRDPELAERSRVLLRTLEWKGTLPSRILQEFPDLPERLAEDPTAGIAVLVECIATDSELRPLHPRLKASDLELLASLALPQGRTSEDRQLVFEVICSRQLGGALPAVRELLACPDPSARRSALNIVETFHDRQSVPILAAMLEDPSLGSEAAWVLSNFRRAGVPLAIRPYLEHPEAHVRLAAMTVLREGTEAAGLPRPLLRSLLQEGDLQVQVRAMRLLVRQYGAGDARTLLEPILTGDDPALRFHALSALGLKICEETGPSLRPLLRSEHPEVRARTIDLLTELRCFEAADDFVELLQDPDVMVRYGAARALDQLRHTEAAPGMIRLLTDPATAIREFGLRCLTDLGCKEVLPLLVDRLRSPDLGTRGETLEWISDPCWKDLAPEVLKLVGDSDAKIRLKVFQVLRAMDDETQARNLLPLLLKPQDPEAGAAAVLLERWKAPEILPRVLELTSHPDADVRKLSLGVLASKAPAEAAPIFLRLLDDPDPEVREKAITGARHLKLAEAIPRLRNLLIDPAGKVARTAALALCFLKDWDSLGGIFNAVPRDREWPIVLRLAEDFRSPEVVPPLERDLDSEDPHVRRATLAFFRDLDHPRATEAIRRVLQVDGHPLQAACMSTLAWLEDRDSIPELLRLLDAPSEELQDAAAHALADLGAREAIPVLRKRLEEDGSVPRRALLTEMARLRADRLAPHILRNLRVEYGASASDAIQDAAKIDLQEARPDLVRLSRGDDLTLRFRASMALLRLGDPAEIPTVLETEGGDLSLLNRFRRPELYERLRTTSQPRTYKGALRRALADFAADAGLALETSPIDAVLGDEDPQIGTVLRRNGIATLLDALEGILNSVQDFSFILEEDRVRLVPCDAAAPFWKHWWKGQAPK